MTSLDKPGVYHAADVQLSPAQVKDAIFIAVDPGIRSPMTAVPLQRVKLADGNLATGLHGDKGLRLPTLALRQWQYMEESGRNLGRKWRRRLRGRIPEAVRAAQAAVAECDASAMDKAEHKRYIDTLQANWETLTRWGFRRKKMQREFYLDRLRQSWLDSTVQRFVKYANDLAIQSGVNPRPTPVILMGNAAWWGGFNWVRCGGPKAPVKELIRRLAKRLPVVLCPEYRTSKLCHFCGQEVKHPTRKAQIPGQANTMYGVSCCRNADMKHSTIMMGRDAMAAFNIGARFVATQLKRDIGPWEKRRMTTAEVKKAVAEARGDAAKAAITTRAQAAQVADKKAMQDGSTKLYEVLQERGLNLLSGAFVGRKEAAAAPAAANA